MILLHEKAPSRPAVDWEANLQLFGGQREMGERFLRRFIELNAATMDELRAAHSANDREAVRALAHKIKGGSASVAAVSLHESATVLEALASGPNPWDQVEQAIARTIEDWTALEEYGN